MPPAGPHLQLVSTAPPEDAVYREALRRIPTATYTTDAEGRITFYNDAAAELWGRRPEIGPELWCGSHRIFDRDGREITLDTCPMAKALKEQGPLTRAGDRDGEALGALSLHFREPHVGNRSEVQFTDMCARHAAEVVEAARVRAELTRADQRKDEFLATLAHELRNPLVPISNALQVLKRRPDPAHSTGALAVMERQLHHLVRRVDDLLDVSRINLGKIELQHARIDLRDVLLGAAEATRPLLQEAGHEMAIDMPVRPLFVHGDATRLAQVFANLLDNAARYTPRGGHVELAAQHEGDAVVARVTDDGIGIPPEMLGRIFEMFVQGRSQLERGGGLGIGLTLVQQLVEMHGGSVRASSEEGRGSQFVVRLPPAPATSAALDEAALAAPMPLASRRVLVVDDNRDAAETLALLLELLGHQTRTVHDGLAAIDAAQEWRPHAVLLDIGMPRLDGYEACRRLRRQPWGEDMLLIALTGWGKEEDQRRSREAGFDAHLVKPVEAEKLEAVLRELLGRRG